MSASGRSLLKRVSRMIPRALRNWLRSPSATLAWLRDELRHRAGADQVVEIRPGWKLRCHPAAWRMAYRAQADDLEQVEELDSFIASCRPGMVLFDLGAHFGMFSLAALHYGGAGARAVAVDPSRPACRMTAAQAAMNGAGSRISVVEAAVAAHPGRREMVPVGVIAAGYFSAATDSHGPGERRTVRAVTVDQLVREQGLWPTHIKVDVEGAEAEALRGARGALTRRPAPLLFLELHNAMLRGRGTNPAETLDILEELDYRLYGLDDRSMSRSAVLDRDLIRIVARSGEVPA